MKGRITTVLSLTGVLVAGSAAAMVNTQVLQSTESKSSGQVAVVSPADSETIIPAVDAGITIDAYTKVQSDVLTATQAMYQIGEAGVVTLDTAGDVLTVVSVTPESGWTLVDVENDGSANVEVKLTDGITIVEFKANLQLGVITTSVESKFVDVTTPGLGSIDDDDDEYDDDDDDVSVTVDVDFDDDDDSGHDDDD